jgi:hypothetical protein
MGRERGGGGERDCWKENEPYVLDVADCREGRFFGGGSFLFEGDRCIHVVSFSEIVHT